MRTRFRRLYHHLYQTTARAALVAALAYGVYQLGLAHPEYLRPRWMNLALSDVTDAPKAGRLDWAEKAPGLEVAELEVYFQEELVDVLHLVRMSPEHYNFIVRIAPENPLLVEDWQRELNAAAVVNGSYFVHGNSPQTPLKVDGVRHGPVSYSAEHGVFLGGGAAEIIDLEHTSYEPFLEKASEAMLSYPLLVSESGEVRAEGNSKWLANRTFIAKDLEGRILFGNSQRAFFSLRRLGHFLRDTASLRISIALNLDGGPLASQMVTVPGFSKRVLGSYERRHNTDPWKDFFDQVRLDRWKLPIVLAAVPVKKEESK